MFQIDGSRGGQVKYGELLKNSLQLANGLRKHGIQASDTLSIVSENRIDYYMPVLAGLFLGVSVNLLNPLYTTSEFLQKKNAKLASHNKDSEMVQIIIVELGVANREYK